MTGDKVVITLDRETMNLLKSVVAELEKIRKELEHA